MFLHHTEMHQYFITIIYDYFILNLMNSFQLLFQFSTIQMYRSPMFKPGDIYNSRFKIINKIAEGSQAVAYLVVDTSQVKQQKNYVLKVAELKPKNKQKIKAQYELINSLNHPNIIKAYSSEDKYVKGIEYFFIIMEYAQGGNLQEFLQKLKQEQIYKIYHQLKSAIEYIHAKGVIHRDLTLVNILLDNKKNVKVIDFGIASQLEQEQSHIESSILEGTRLYKPQQLIQQFIVSKQNDLWQLGITLIQLATKKEISQLTNNKKPFCLKIFPEQVFKKYNVNQKFRSMISPLLRNNYKERKFCEDIFWIQPVLYETRLKLTEITDIKLYQSIKEIYKQSLLQLNCSNCLLTDDSGRTIRLLNNLQKLDLSGNNLTDKFTYYIQYVLLRLDTLKLAFTDIRDKSLQLITQKSLILKQLDISYTLVTSTGIMMLPKLSKLISLAIWSDQYFYPHRYEDIIKMRRNQKKYQNNKIIISQQCIKQLCKLKLTEICINADERDINELILKMSKQSKCVEVKGKMNSKSVEYICGMEKLQKVYLYQAKEFEIKEFRSKELISSGLIQCNMNKNQLVKSLSKCNKLLSLNLYDNNIGNQEAVEIANNMKNLISLNLLYNQIGDQGVIQIAKSLKNLIYLDLGNNNIGKQGAIQIAKNMKNLICLNLGVNNIGKQGTMEIAENMKSLISLDLRNNNIGDQGAIEIAKNMKSLKYLNLVGNNIDNKNEQLIKKLLPSTRIWI